ncbi:MAG: hypothetical protein BroJett007_33750 [Chloroflexota bacterium]|nr:MAG: hypothetical protein BroJett007_33750 [Chloroflexota bacterium]
MIDQSIDPGLVYAVATGLAQAKTRHRPVENKAVWVVHCPVDNTVPGDTIHLAEGLSGENWGQTAPGFYLVRLSYQEAEKWLREKAAVKAVYPCVPVPSRLLDEEELFEDTPKVEEEKDSPQCPACNSTEQAAPENCSSDSDTTQS